LTIATKESEKLFLILLFLCFPRETAAAAGVAGAGGGGGSRRMKESWSFVAWKRIA